MLVTDHEQIYTYDVDGTLIGLVRHSENPGGNSVAVFDPYTRKTYWVHVNQAHIDLLHAMHERGRYIVVWSASGVKWAKAVVDALDIGQWVNEVKTKPIAYIDDKASATWMSHIYLGPVAEEKQ